MVEGAPAWVRRHFGRPAAYFELLLLDHGLFRLLYLNHHQISPRAYRAAQPAPHDVARFARQGVRTIINLRGPRDCSSYALEKAACNRYGVTLVNYQVRSRAAPTAAEIKGAIALFDTIEYPILMHCKSGADRAGLMSVLYSHFKEGKPMEEAVKHLSLRFGHISQADTGVLDYVFERYLTDHVRRPIPFLEWVDTVYDPDEVKRSFHAKGWANRLVNSVLRRE